MNEANNLRANINFAGKIMFHPFSSFWDLKRENKGSKFFAVLIDIFLVVVLLLRRQLTGFILNYNISSEMNIITQITGVILPIALWCISNWSISTLVDGEQNFSDIFISTSYSLIPLVIFNIPMVFLSNVISQQEIAFYNILDSVSILWTVLLIFISCMVINQFSIKKTIFTLIITFLGMIVIMFFVLLFFAVSQQLMNFALLIFKELSLR